MPCRCPVCAAPLSAAHDDGVAAETCAAGCYDRRVVGAVIAERIGARVWTYAADESPAQRRTRRVEQAVVADRYAALGGMSAEPPLVTVCVLAAAFLVGVLWAAAFVLRP
jgi:hypothetical protein